MFCPAFTCLKYFPWVLGPGPKLFFLGPWSSVSCSLRSMTNLCQPDPGLVILLHCLIPFGQSEISRPNWANQDRLSEKCKALSLNKRNHIVNLLFFLRLQHIYFFLMWGINHIDHKLSLCIFFTQVKLWFWHHGDQYVIITVFYGSLFAKCKNLLGQHFYFILYKSFYFEELYVLNNIANNCLLIHSKVYNLVQNSCWCRGKFIKDNWFRKLSRHLDIYIFKSWTRETLTLSMCADNSIV